MQKHQFLGTIGRMEVQLEKGKHGILLEKFREFKEDFLEGTPERAAISFEKFKRYLYSSDCPCEDDLRLCFLEDLEVYLHEMIRPSSFIRVEYQLQQLGVSPYCLPNPYNTLFLPIKGIGLSNQAYKVLISHFNDSNAKLGQVAELSRNALLRENNCGKATVTEIENKLHELGLEWNFDCGKVLNQIPQKSCEISIIYLIFPKQTNDEGEKT